VKKVLLNPLELHFCSNRHILKVNLVNLNHCCMSHNYSELHQVHVCWNVDNNLLSAKFEVLTSVTVKIKDLDVWHQVLCSYLPRFWMNKLHFQDMWDGPKMNLQDKMSFQLVLDWLELLQSNWLFSNDNTVLRVITLHCTCGDSNLTKTVVSASGPGSNMVLVCKKCECSISLSYHQSLCKHD